MRGDYYIAMEHALDDVARERMRQDAKWGEQNHPDGTGDPGSEAVADIARDICNLAAQTGALAWRDVLREEFFEALAEKDPVKLREELVQVAAVAVAWIEAIDRRATS